MPTAWIQRYDFTSKELGELTKSKIIDAFNGQDWRAELSYVSASDPNANCPPGFGIKSGADILHLCPSDASNMFFHLHFEVEVKFLGLFPTKRRRSHYVECYPLTDAYKVISYFMNGDLKSIQMIK